MLRAVSLDWRNYEHVSDALKDDWDLVYVAFDRCSRNAELSDAAFPAVMGGVSLRLKQNHHFAARLLELAVSESDLVQTSLGPHVVNLLGLDLLQNRYLHPYQSFDALALIPRELWSQRHFVGKVAAMWDHSSGERDVCLRHASAELRGDREIVQAAVSQKGIALRWASKDLRANYGLVRIAVLQDSSAFEFSLCEPADWTHDKQFVLKLLEKKGRCSLSSLGEDLRSDRDVFAAALALPPPRDAVTCTTYAWQKDKQMVLQLLEPSLARDVDFISLAHIDEGLKNDRDIFIAALHSLDHWSRDPHDVLAFTSYDWRKDKEALLKVLQFGKGPVNNAARLLDLCGIPAEFLADPDVVRAIIVNNPVFVRQDFPYQWRADKEIVVELLKNEICKYSHVIPYRLGQQYR